MTRIKLMIADDHRLFREGIKALLAVTDDLEIVGEAEDGESVIKKCEELQPDVILMDINMPGLNGIRATEQILQRQPQTRIVMLTMLEDDASVFNAMRVGALLEKGSDTLKVRRRKGNKDTLLAADETPIPSGEAFSFHRVRPPRYPRPPSPRWGGYRSSASRR